MKAIDYHIYNIEYESYIFKKIYTRPFAAIVNKATDTLGGIYIDHCGPINPAFLASNIYMLTICNEATGYLWAYFVHTKNAKLIIAILKQ